MSMTGHDTSSTARYPEETARSDEGSRPTSAEGVAPSKDVRKSLQALLKSGECIPWPVTIRPVRTVVRPRPPFPSF